MNNIITRFAPSPTGYLHIGNIRIALYSWLYAKKYNGKFILRIEDTNINKFNKKYSDYIFYILEWLGLYWDDGPYYQSDRIDLYNDIINYMLLNNLAYKCYCSKKRLNKLRSICLIKKIKPCYDKFCRNKNFSFNKKKPYVVRFKNPLYGKVIFNDFIFNKIKINNNQLDDIIIKRSNGLPTYNFCVVIDDYYMSISHVIRGEDHLNNTSKQINIFNSLNYRYPNYIHLPMIFDLNKKKLSKRNLSYNIINYINKGFLPESLLNYLLYIGLSSINNEIINLHEMKHIFNIYNIKKSPCILNIKKIYWLNKYYINNLSYNRIYKYFIFFLKYKNIKLDIINNISEIITFILPRSKSLYDIYNFCIIFNKYIKIKKHEFIKFYNINSFKILLFFLKNILNINIWNYININNILNILMNKFNYLNKNYIYNILYYFLIGKINGPNLINIILLLKKKKLIFRLKFFLREIFLSFSFIK